MQNAPRILKPWQRTRTVNDQPIAESVTDTSPGNNTNINEIVKRFARTGEMPVPPPSQPEPQYVDCTGLQGDLTNLINKQKSALAELKTLETAHAKQTQQKIQKQLKELETLKQQQAENLITNPPQTPPPAT